MKFRTRLSKVVKGAEFNVSYFIYLLALCLFASAVFAVKMGNYAFRKINHGSETIYIDLDRGTGLSKFARQLARRKIISHPNNFVWLVWLKGDSRKLQAGEYAIKPNSTVIELINDIRDGNVVVHQLRFSEGSHFSEIMKSLAEHKSLKHETEGLDNAAIMQLLNSPYQNPEGLFFPDTYKFVKGVSDLYLLRQAYAAMDRNLQSLWQFREPNLPYKTPYEALIAASLIEKETSINDEKHLIGAVIVNRLEKGMPLQFDPTVIYGLGDAYQGKLSKKDLRIDSPYNTYKHHGLPPTPIAMPSQASLEGAIYPSNKDYLFFVATGKGGHHFSTTLVEHQQAVKAYYEELKNKKPKEQPKAAGEKNE